MPALTRAQRRPQGVNVEGNEANVVSAPVQPSQQRNVARARGSQRGRIGVWGTSRRSKSFSEVEEQVFFDDEEPDIGKTLQVKDGKVSFKLLVQSK